MDLVPFASMLTKIFRGWIGGFLVVLVGFYEASNGLFTLRRPKKRRSVAKKPAASPDTGGVLVDPWLSSDMGPFCLSVGSFPNHHE